MNVIKRYRDYFFTFFLSLFLVCMLFFMLGIKWNGKSILVTDNLSQLYPLLYFLKHSLRLYTFKIGCGLGMMGTFAYYLISPVNILAFVIDNLQDAIIFITAVKMALAATTMYYYLDVNYPKEKKLYMYFFALTYMLSSWIVKYVFFVQWFDAYYLLPLVALGIEKLINNKSPFLYLISLFLVILCNYYIGYMVCIFCVIYFIYKLYNSDVKNKNVVVKKFIFYSLFAGLLTSFVTYPTLLSMMNIGRFEPDLLEFSFASPKVLGGLFFGAIELNIDEYFLVFAYTGVLNIILLILYFFNDKYSLKERKSTLVLFIIFVISLIFMPIYYLWHVLSLPNALPARFSFLLIFMIVITAYRSFIKLDYKNLKRCCILTSIICLAVCFNNIYIVIFNVCLIFLYYIFIVKKKSYLCFLLLFLELYFSFVTSLNISGIENNYFEVNNKYSEKLPYSTVNRYIKSKDSYHQNGGLVFSNNTSLIFLSTDSGNYIENIPDYIVNFSRVSFLADDEINEFFNVMLNNEYYQLESGEILVNKTFGYGALVSRKSVDGKYLKRANSVFKSMTGFENDIYAPVELNSDSEYGKYYIVINDVSYKGEKDSIHDFFVYNSDDSIGIVVRNGHSVIKSIYTSDTDFKLIGDLPDSYGFTVYKFNQDIYDEGVKILQENSISDFVYSEGGYMSGYVNVKSADRRTLFMSVAYEDGWSAYVDGNKTDIIELYGGFIGIDLDEGEHYVEFKYETPGLKVGYCISIVSLITLIVLERRKLFEK